MDDKRYLKVKMPPADARSSTSEFYDWNVRFGAPEVWLVDEQGNEIEQVFGISGVSITASAGQFMTVTIDANANVEF